MNIALLYYLSFSFATIVIAFQFICFDGSQSECSLNNLYPEYEGTFVLQHIPRTANILIFTQLIASTIDHALLSELPPTVTNVLVNDSNYVTKVIVPANTTFVSLLILKTGLRAIWFENNRNLSQLIIEQAQLDHIPPTLLSLRSLGYVKISYTLVQHLNMSLFCNFTQLQTIDLKYNRIYSITQPRPMECSSPLVELLLGNNRLKRIIPIIFAPFRNLALIDLSHNLIESIAGRFKNAELCDLLMNNNLLTRIDLCEWAPMPQISYLYLERNKLTRVPECLHRLANLYSINLENNLLSNVTIDTFTPLKQLQYIRFSWNPIVSFTLREEAIPPKLLQIDVRHTYMEQINVSQKLIQRFKINT